MFKLVIALLTIVGLTSTTNAQQTSAAARSELTPTGKLRVGINFGNALLATKDANGVPAGIAVDLARELTRRLGVPLDIVSYSSAGVMADGAKTGSWDVAFLAADPDRAGEIAFTSPYLGVDATYLVPSGSTLRTISDVDRAGIRIAVSDKSAYDLYLTRNLKNAELVRIPGVVPSIDLFFASTLDAVAALKPVLIEVAEKHPGTRVLEGRISVALQAVGTPRGREAAAEYLVDFVADVKTSGFVARLIEKNGLRGVEIPMK